MQFRPPSKEELDKIFKTDSVMFSNLNEEIKDTGFISAFKWGESLSKEQIDNVHHFLLQKILEYNGKILFKIY